MRKLKLRGTKQNLTLTTLDRQDRQIQTTAVNLEIAALDTSTFVTLDNVYTRKDIPIKEENMGTAQDINKWPHLRDISIPAVDAKNVMLLIGQDNPDILLPREVRNGNRGEPYATRSLLGWTINGPLGLEYDKCRRHVTSNFVTMDDTLQKQVETFWKVDDWEALLNERPGMSVEDRHAVNIFERSIQLEEGHYTLDVPFRTRPPALPHNRDVAETRLLSLKRRLLRNDDLRETYCREMQSIIDKGYAEPVTNVMGPVGSTWYLPHHPVTHASKAKTRIVFDCAATKKGVSLNDRVLQGPDMTNSLLGVLLRFRQEPIALMADIEAMFHQVRVTERDRDALRFLWWPDGDLCKDPQDYRMTVHLFGGNWSPSCCNFALRKTAEDNQCESTSDAGRRVGRDFYVDDCLTSVKNEDDATTLVAEMKELLERGGFNLTKWITNSRRVLATIPEEDRARDVKGLDLTFEALPVERALGVCWDVDSDTFEFRINMPDKPLTRRGLLSAISSIYDPMGFLCPFTLRPKKIIQDLTRKKLSWDEPLPKDELMRWQDWISELPNISAMRIPRCLKPQDANDLTEYELHHFADASEIAYGVVTYLRAIDENDNAHSTLVMAKSRLAPVKTMTIPRLELAAAALSVKVDSVVRRELDIDIKKSVFWTDSTIVLGYISNVNKRFQTYVANRISAIHQGSTLDQWHHIESSLNPADDVSRGLSANDIVQSERWILGPSFLRGVLRDLAKSSCSSHDIPDGDPEIKRLRNVTARSYLVDVTRPARDIGLLIDSYSTWYKLKRGIAWMLRFKSWLLSRVRKHPATDMNRALDVMDLRSAENAIVKYVQFQHFKQEMTTTTTGGATTKPTHSRGNSLHGLRPILSEEGLLSVGGRLRKANCQLNGNIRSSFRSSTT